MCEWESAGAGCRKGLWMRRGMVCRECWVMRVGFVVLWKGVGGRGERELGMRKERVRFV
ncbi:MULTISPECIES: hypothetical protein [Bartonella]|uniref:hypothetical protein n=1 Tax=Bartonella TaxID=773 RepID=UPI001ABCEA05|nr:hypothetical protein [Bartonella capreoli]